MESMRDRGGRRRAPEPPKKPAKILLVEDHPLMREAMAERLKSATDFEIGGEAAGVRQALNFLTEVEFTAAVIDIALPDGNGLDLIRRMSREFPAVRTLAFSMYDEEVYGVRAIQAGASGYLNKHEPSVKLTEALRTIIRGDYFVSASLGQKLIGMQSEGSRNGFAGDESCLSDRELEIYGLIGEGLATREIAERLHLSVHTIDTHREHMKKKLGNLTGNELNRSAILWRVENA